MLATELLVISLIVVLPLSHAAAATALGNILFKMVVLSLMVMLSSFMLDCVSVRTVATIRALILL